MRIYINIFCFLQDLPSNRTGPFSEESLIALFDKRKTTLKRLNIAAYHLKTNSELQYLSECQQLEELSIYELGCHDALFIRDVLESISIMINLISLKLTGAKYSIAGPDYYQELLSIKNLSNLSSLHLENLKLNHEVLKMITFFCDKIETFYFNCEYDAAHLQALCHCKNLKNLYIRSNNNNTGEKSMLGISSATLIELFYSEKEQQLTYTTSNEQSALDPVVKPRMVLVCPFRNLSRLNFLSIISNPQINDEVIKSIAYGCPNLESFQLSANVDLYVILFLMTKLNSLNLSYSQITFNGSFSEKFEHENLKVLNLSNCRGINEKIIENIAVGCPNLHKVNLMHTMEANGIVKKCLKYLVEKCTNIEELNFGGDGPKKGMLFGIPFLLELKEHVSRLFVDDIAYSTSKLKQMESIIPPFVCR